MAPIVAFFSERNLVLCERVGIKLPCIPQRGGKKTMQREAFEKSTAFKEGRRFRAGIEGRISVLFRCRGMKRCLAEGLVCVLRRLLVSTLRRTRHSFNDVGFLPPCHRMTARRMAFATWWHGWLDGEAHYA
jgi:hypothetical protein